VRDVKLRDVDFPSCPTVFYDLQSMRLSTSIQFSRIDMGKLGSGDIDSDDSMCTVIIGTMDQGRKRLDPLKRSLDERNITLSIQRILQMLGIINYLSRFPDVQLVDRTFVNVWDRVRKYDGAYKRFIDMCIRFPSDRTVPTFKRFQSRIGDVYVVRFRESLRPFHDKNNACIYLIPPTCHVLERSIMGGGSLATVQRFDFSNVLGSTLRN